MLEGLLRKLDDALGRPDAAVLALAVEVLHKGLGRLDDVCLQAVQGSLNDGVPLAF